MSRGASVPIARKSIHLQPKGTHLKWSKKEKDVLIKMATRGCTSQEIAKVLKSRTINGIQCKAHELGYSLDGPDPKIDFEAYTEITGEVIEG